MSDPLSDVLELVSARCSLSGRLVAGGDWTRRFANVDAVKILAVTDGACWYSVDGMTHPAPFKAGDVLVTNGKCGLVLASDPALIAHAPSTPRIQDEHGVYRLGHGNDIALLGGIVGVDDRRSPPLFGALPPFIHIGASAPDAAEVAWLLRRIDDEMRAVGKAGQALMLAQLTQLLFVQTLRAYLACTPAGDAGWIKGLGDPKLAPALAKMHAEPAHGWNLEDLAHVAGMSRTAFAVRFREVMEMPPLSYLTNWRMLLAERELRGGASIAEAAEAIGYTSESAFSNAFKRTLGVAPGRLRKVPVEGRIVPTPPSPNSIAHRSSWNIRLVIERPAPFFGEVSP